MAQIGLRLILFVVIVFGVQKLYSAKRPLNLNRFQTVSLEDEDVQTVNMLLPKNLSVGDKPTTTMLKFLGHNLKNLKKKGMFKFYEKTLSTIFSPSIGYTSKKNNSFTLHDDLDLEIRFKADWSKRKLRMWYLNSFIKGEMAYILGSNQFVMSLSKDIFDGVDLSLMNIKELSNSNNLLSLNLSFNL